MKLSLLFTEQHIHCAVGTADGKKMVVNQVFSLPIPEGAVTVGHLLDSKALAETLQQGLKEHKVGVRQAIVTVYSPRIAFRELLVPKASLQDLGGLVKHEMSSALNLKMHHLLDYLVVGEEPQGERMFYRILASAVDKEIIEPFRETLELAGLRPEAMDICQNSLAKILPLCKNAGTQAEILCDLRDNYLMISLFDEGKWVLTRGSTLYSYGATRDPLSAVLSIEQNISKVLQFYTKRMVGRILLTGDFSVLEGVGETIGAEFGIPTYTMEPGEGITLPQGLENFSLYSGPIGALIRK